MERMFAPQQEKVSSPPKFVKGAQNLGQHHYFRKFNADFSVEMSRSVKEMLKNWE